MPGRKYQAGTGLYRYGFNGKENDNEVKGEGNQQDYGERIYDTILGKFLSVDPLSNKFVSLSPYQFSGCNPILFIDLDGDEPKSAPLPGENGLTLQAPQLQGADAGKLMVWMAVNGQWAASKLPTPSASSYQGKSTYYDVAKAKYGIPEGTQSSSHNIQIPGYFGAFVAQPVFNEDKVVSHYIVGEWKNVLDVPGGRSMWVNVCIIKAEDMPDWYARPEKINALSWGNSNSLKTKLLAENGDIYGSLVNNWKEVNTDPMTWVNAALIFAGGLSEGEGIIYERIDMTGGLKPYVGQAMSPERFAARIKEHARAHPNADFEFKIIDKGTRGINLDLKEQKALDARGGPTNKSHPNGGTSNKRNVIKKTG